MTTTNTTTQRYFQAFVWQNGSHTYGWEAPRGFFGTGKHYATEAEARAAAEAYHRRPIMVAEYIQRPGEWSEKVREVVID